MKMPPDCCNIVVGTFEKLRQAWCGWEIENRWKMENTPYKVHYLKVRGQFLEYQVELSIPSRSNSAEASHLVAHWQEWILGYLDTWIVHFGRNEAFDPELLLQPATKVPVAAPCAGKTCYEAARTHTPCTRRERTHPRASRKRTHQKLQMYNVHVLHTHAGRKDTRWKCWFKS